MTKEPLSKAIAAADVASDLNRTMKETYSMRIKSIVFFAGLVAYVPLCIAEDLALLGAYPIEGEAGLQPSGIAVCDGRLLMISDKHDRTIFELLQDGDTFTATPYQSIAPPPAPDNTLPLSYRLINWARDTFYGSQFDWEDIACGPTRTIFLLSESTGNILTVEGNRGRWLAKSLYQAVHNVGFLNAYNAGFEGLEWTPSKFYLAIERQPRGIATLTIQNGSISAVHLPDSPLPRRFSGNRGHDITAIRIYKGFLYSLERNYAGICKRDIETYRSMQCWSFANTDLDPKYRYNDSHYGLAEGFTVADQSLYVVYDNNGKTRLNNPTDSRPLLFRFSLPSDW